MQQNKSTDTQDVKRDIEIIRQALTRIFGSMTRIESYEKAKSNSGLLEFLTDRNEVFFINEKGARAIWRIENADKKLICWAVSPTDRETHGWTFGLKTKEEAIQVRESRKIN